MSNTLTTEERLDQILYSLYNNAYIESNKPLNRSSDTNNYIVIAKQRLIALINEEREKTKNRETELLDSLYWMYVQYIGDSKWGHKFMGAGETASMHLEDAGYIVCDNIGSVVKDNGDSHQQRIQTLSQGGKNKDE